MKSYNIVKRFIVALFALFVCFGITDWAAAAPVQTAKRGAEIIITFRNIPSDDKANVDGNYPVSHSDGTISMPYLSSRIKVEGKDSRQLEEIIKARYVQEQIYSHPIVVVQVGSSDEIKALNQRYVQVTGYVGAKKNLPYRPDMTLISAIVDCGDITEHGSRYIQVSRGSVTRTYDYFSARDRALKLLPDDSIFVQPRGAFEGRPSKIGP